MSKAEYSQKDRSILRQLAEKQAAIAADPVHQTTIAQWKRSNRLERGKPMVWVNEICWPELGPDVEPQCTDPFCRTLESQFRRTIYQWEHLRADMVVEPKLLCSYVTHETSFGLAMEEKTILQGDAGSISSHQYKPVIHDEADVEKIHTPRVTLDLDATEEKYQRLTGLVGDILPVEKSMRVNWWFAPWDLLVTWWGAEEALTDLAMRPEMVHRAMDRLVTAFVGILDQYEALGLLSLNNDNIRIGSGGLGYSDQLPQKDFNPKKVRFKDLWGCGAAQIFSEVSPQMHWDFALKYEIRWLERFGLNYYGCCEPLHHKVHILKRIPNLRKVSMSPRADIEKGAAALGADYVYSMKPNPAILAGDNWNPQAARAELRSALEKTRGCVVEIILKDISTVRNDPHRLMDWVKIATELAAEFA